MLLGQHFGNRASCSAARGNLLEWGWTWRADTAIAELPSAPALARDRTSRPRLRRQ